MEYTMAAPKASMHRLSNVNRETLTATCQICGEVALALQKSNNSVKCAVAQRDSIRDNATKKVAKRKEKRLAILATQDFKCAICDKSINDGDMDHCHTTDYQRGILCPPCNKALGYFNDNTITMARAIEYVNHHASRTDERKPFHPYRYGSLAQIQ